MNHWAESLGVFALRARRTGTSIPFRSLYSMGLHRMWIGGERVFQWMSFDKGVLGPLRFVGVSKIAQGPNKISARFRLGKVSYDGTTKASEVF